MYKKDEDNCKSVIALLLVIFPLLIAPAPCWRSQLTFEWAGVQVLSEQSAVVGFGLVAP